jgi:glucokinase
VSPGSAPAEVRAGGSSALVGVDLGGTKCHGVLTDAEGRVLQESYRTTTDAPEAVDVLLQVLSDLRRAADGAGRTVAGYGIGIPAFVDRTTGLVVGGLNVGWEGFDLQSRLQAELDAPFALDNDVNVAALAEARLGAGRGASSFVTVAVGTGLGGAVVVGGQLLRGHHNAAGEIGYLLAGRHQLGRPGLLGMESVVGGLAIAERSRALEGLPDGAAPGAAAVLAAAERGDPEASALLQEVLEHLAMTVVDLVAVVDPERVVLDGGIGRALGPYLPRLRALVEPSVLYPPELHVSTLRPTAALAGAVSEARRVAGLPERAPTPAGARR